jgi:adenosylmethionine---8-amino-7-oxononanoate aminotransferase
MPDNSVNNGPDDLVRHDKQNIWHPFTSLGSESVPVHIIKGEGVYLHTSDGRRIIDAISSWWVNLHGHSNPEIAKAIAQQATNLEHVIFAGFTHEPAIRLSENLKSILPSNQEKIFFSDNGSTAVEVALKLGIQYWHNQGIKKSKVVAFEGSYHGDTFGSMSVGSRGSFNSAFEPFLFDVQFIPVPTDKNHEQVVRLLSEIVKDDDVAAFIYEPLVQAAAGMVMYEPEWLNNLLEVCQTYNVICIADEVFTGFGRTGKLLASDYMTLKPDLIALSKGITGGALPLGVTCVSAKIVDAFRTFDRQKTFFHGHSYTANPLACAAANASFALLVSETCQQRIVNIARQHEDFRKKITGHPAVKNARCFGTIVAVELRTKEGTHYFNAMRDQIYNHFMSRNILLRPLGNIIYILPPYVITREELNSIYKEIELFLDQVI